MGMPWLELGQDHKDRAPGARTRVWGMGPGEGLGVLTGTGTALASCKQVVLGKEKWKEV